MLNQTATKLSSPETALRYLSARDPMVSMIAVRGLVEALEQRGIPRDKVLRELRCDAERLHVSDARLPLLEQ